MEERIEPEPEAAERAAILTALALPPPPLGGWAEVALREGVSAGGPMSLYDHDVCSLW